MIVDVSSSSMVVAAGSPPLSMSVVLSSSFRELSYRLCRISGSFPEVNRCHWEEFGGTICRISVVSNFERWNRFGFVSNNIATSAHSFLHPHRGCYFSHFVHSLARSFIAFDTVNCLHCTVLHFIAFCSVALRPQNELVCRKSIPQQQRKATENSSDEDDRLNWRAIPPSLANLDSHGPIRDVGSNHRHCSCTGPKR